jgi:hypothetical protein
MHGTVAGGREKQQNKSIKQQHTLKRTHTMSAFIVSKKHIDALGAFAIRPEYGAQPSYYFKNQLCRIDLPDYAGQVLWDGTSNRLITGMMIVIKPENYTFDYTARSPPAVQIIKLCNCLDYQSCETPDWKDTRAYALLDNIRERAIRELPGYDNAPWDLWIQNNDKQHFGRYQVGDKVRVINPNLFDGSRVWV